MSGPSDTVVIDMTIRLSNSTAVYEIASELYKLLPEGALVRYWRIFTTHNFEFLSTQRLKNVGLLIHKLACLDFDNLTFWTWPRRPGLRMLFVDPVYCAVTEVKRRDIVIIYDLGAVTQAKDYNKNAYISANKAFLHIQKAAPRLVFVSAAVQSEFLTAYPADYLSSQVVNLYLRSRLAVPVGSIRKEKTILMVGCLEYRKNHARAIEAFLRSELAKRGYRLKIAGPLGNSAEGVVRLAGLTDAVSYEGFVDDSSLGALYCEAEILLFPSTLEGFGVPALEGPRFNLIPVVSELPVFREIVGSSGIYVDPASVESIKNGLIRAAALSSEERASVLAEITKFQARYSVESFRASWAKILSAEEG